MAVSHVEGLVDVVVVVEGIVEDEGNSLEEETGEMGEMGEMGSPPAHTPLPALLAIDPFHDPAPDPVRPRPVDLLRMPTLADTPTDTPIVTENEIGVTVVVTKEEVNHLEIDQETRDGLPAVVVVVVARPSIPEKEITVALPHHAVLPRPLLQLKFESEARAGVGLSHVLLPLVVRSPVRVLHLDPCHVHVPLLLFAGAAATDANTDDEARLTAVGA